MVNDDSGWLIAQYFAQFVLCAIFAQSFIAKLRDSNGFRQSLKNYRLVPNRYSHGAAFLVILAEATAIILLTFHPSLLALGFELSLALLSLFSFAIAVALYRRIDLTCGCFGQTSQTNYLDLVRNAILIGVAVLGTISLQQHRYIFDLPLFALSVPPAMLVSFAMSNLKSVVEALRFSAVH